MGALQSQLVNNGLASNEKTPWNPSRKATSRVLDSIPAPTTCRYCGEPVEICTNDKIYHGRQYGDWPWIYRCTSNACDSYVGMHPFTNIPLGTLADKATREARKQAKTAFNPLWEKGRMGRTQAYAWLAQRLGIQKHACHIGMFDADMCERVVEICATSALSEE